MLFQGLSGIEFDELRTVDVQDEDGKAAMVVIGRLTEVRFIEPKTVIVLLTQNVPYGSTLYKNDKEMVQKGDVIAKWDPFNAVIVTEVSGKIEFVDVIENRVVRSYNEVGF